MSHIADASQSHDGTSSKHHMKIDTQHSRSSSYDAVSASTAATTAASSANNAPRVVPALSQLTPTMTPSSSASVSRSSNLQHRSFTPRVILTRTDIPVQDVDEPAEHSGVIRATTMTRITSYQDLQRVQDHANVFPQEFDDDEEATLSSEEAEEEEEARLMSRRSSAMSSPATTAVGSYETCQFTESEISAFGKTTKTLQFRGADVLDDDSSVASSGVVSPIALSPNTSTSTQLLLQTAAQNGFQKPQRRRDITNAAAFAQQQLQQQPPTAVAQQQTDEGAAPTLFESPPTVRQVSIQLVKSINSKWQLDLTVGKRDVDGTAAAAPAAATGITPTQTPTAAAVLSSDAINSSNITTQANRSKKTVRQICQPRSNVELKWESDIKRILIVKQKYDDSINDDIINMIRFLADEKQSTVYMEPDVHRKLLDKDPNLGLHTYDEEDRKHLHAMIDLIIVCGGDGTMLHAASMFPTAVPPLLAFNTGSIGFLTSFATISNYRSVLENVFTGKTFISIRMRLTCRVHRAQLDSTSPSSSETPAAEQNGNSQPTASSSPDGALSRSERYQVLNDVVIDRGVSPFLTSLEMYVNDAMVTTVAADGIIAASPTGSTAYSMSAGGSMVHPDVPSILLTPICPHSLSFRPIVLPDTVVLKFRVSERSRGTAWVSFDGKWRQELRRGDSVEIQTSVWPLPVICSEYSTQDWFKTLSTLLHWNTRQAQKELFLDDQL